MEVHLRGMWSIHTEVIVVNSFEHENTSKIINLFTLEPTPSSATSIYIRWDNYYSIVVN